MAPAPSGLPPSKVSDRIVWLLAVVACLSSRFSLADPPATEVLATGFGWPAAVAVRPLGSGEEKGAAVDEVFLYTPATGRILQVAAEQPSSPARVAALTPPREGNGVAAFISPTTLLVAAASRERNQALIHVVDVNATKADEPAAPRAAVGPASPSGEVILETTPAEYTGLVATAKGVVAALARQGEGRQILRGRRLGGLLTGLQPLAAAAVFPAEFRPRGLTLDGRGFAVAVVESENAVAGEPDAKLVFFSPERNTGPRSTAGMRLDLTGVRAIACSSKPTPHERRVYALGRDGLYRLDSAVDNEGNAYATGVRLLDVDRPGGLAFSKEGRLYVTHAGATGDGELLRVAGEF